VTITSQGVAEDYTVWNAPPTTAFCRLLLHSAVGTLPDYDLAGLHRFFFEPAEKRGGMNA
jgi:hypothetical protein